jgi:hypothetical protein
MPFVEQLQRSREKRPTRQTEDELVAFSQELLMATAVFPEAEAADEDIESAARAAAGVLMIAADEAGPRKGGIEVATSDLTQLTLYRHLASGKDCAALQERVEQQRSPVAGGCALMVLALPGHLATALLARVHS